MTSDPSDADFLADALDQLIEGDFQARWEAVKRISAIGSDAIAQLVRLLEDEALDWEVRWFAARALSTFEETSALEALMRLLQRTQDPELIAMGAEGLSHYGEKGISALITLLADPAHRLTAIQALANIRHNSVLMPLLSASGDTNPAVRQVAIAALANFRDPKVDQVLIDAVKDPVAGVRQAAIANLGLRPHLLETMNLVEILRPGLWDLHPDVNQAAAIALGRLGTDPAVSSLAHVLHSPYTPESLQLQIVRALGWSEKASAVGILVAARPTTPMAVQIEIVRVLSYLRSPRLRQQASAILMDWLQTSLSTPAHHAELKRAIALALANLQHHPAQSLLEAMMLNAEEEAQTCLYAEAALRQLTADQDRS